MPFSGVTLQAQEQRTYIIKASVRTARGEWKTVELPWKGTHPPSIHMSEVLAAIRDAAGLPPFGRLNVQGLEVKRAEAA